jgi:hypothetical protein
VRPTALVPDALEVIELVTPSVLFWLAAADEEAADTRNQDAKPAFS